MAASMSVAPRLNEYVFTEKLGSGTYATVFKAYKKSGSREVVAVKCVLKSSLNAASTENLLTEIELLKTLMHQHIVQLKDFRWDGSYIYLIMEYCAGGDLSRFIRSKRTVSEHMAKIFLQQIALALQYMRSKNVSHMDLKPQNILVTSPENPVLKLGDFGFAHYLMGETETSFLRGSPLYMAPEIVIKRQYNEKADLWSVGIILYECLFGRPPFASRSLQEVGLKIKDTKPIEIPHGFHISSKCRSLLHGLLKRHPDERMSFEEFFRHPFVDLEHRPQRDSLEKAIRLVKEAVEKDSAGDFKAAVNLYCRAFEYFIAAIHFESNARKKEALRKKVKEYMSRTEELKSLLRPRQRTSQGGTRTATATAEHLQYRELVKLSCDKGENNPLYAALKVIDKALAEDSKQDYEAALQHFQLALESLLKILHNEPPGKRKDLLQSLLPKWMSRAEEIKIHLEVRDLEVDPTEMDEPGPILNPGTSDRNDSQVGTSTDPGMGTSMGAGLGTSMDNGMGTMPVGTSTEIIDEAKEATSEEDQNKNCVIQ